MSDGECLVCAERTWQGTAALRFSSVDTHCRRCGAPKWFARDPEGARRRIRVICEFIAAVERGRHEQDRS